MHELEAALDYVHGLHKAYLALSESFRIGPLAENARLRKRLRQELSAGTDAYISALVASPGGELTTQRLEECRAEALSRAATAQENQMQLTALVVERRIPLDEFRADLRQLLVLCLNCRAALAALVGSVESAIGKKVLVELRDATLIYVSTSRSAHGVAPGGARGDC